MLRAIAWRICVPIIAAGVAFSLPAADLCVKVVDDSELPLPKVAITATRLADRAQYQAQTDSRGGACVLKLAEGLYAVEASAVGFMTVRYYPVRVAYPSGAHLSFRLPVAEVAEGGMFGDALVSGTLLFEGKPISGASICALDSKQNRHCTVASGLGEYALALAPGAYQIEIRAQNGDMFRLNIDAPTPDVFRDLLSVKESNRFVP
jgi:hypothetical protein